MSRKSIWKFFLWPIFFAALEILWRLGGPADLPPLAPWSPKQLRQVSRLQTPLGGLAAPKMPKPEGALRVFCLGESTVAIPWFSAFLKEELILRRPGVSWEVINGGVIGIDLHYFLKIAEESLDYSPDLLVVYFGHNYAKRFPRIPSFLFPALRALDRSVFVRWMMQWARKVDALLHPPRSGIAELAEGLSRLAMKAREKGVPIVLCIPESNLWHPPHVEPALYEERSLLTRYGAGLFRFESRDWKQALTVFSGLREDHPSRAIFHYYTGYALTKLHLWEDAVRELETARELDSGKSRATVQVKDVLRSLAGQYHLMVADMEKLMRGGSHGRIVDYRYFVDDCHPKRGVYRWIVREVAAAASKAGPFLGEDAPGSILESNPSLEIGRLLETSLFFLLQDSETHRYSEQAVAPLVEALRLDATETSDFFHRRSMDGLAEMAAGWGVEEKEVTESRERMRIYAAIAARRLGKRKLAREFFEEALRSRNPQILGLAYLQLGVDAYLERHPRHALSFFRKARETDPSVIRNPWFYCRPASY